MPSNARNLAALLGNRSTVASSKLENTDGGSGVTSYTSLANLPLSHSAGDMAFVDSSDRLYVSNGEGWYSVSIVNATPTITSVLDSDGDVGPFTLSTDGANTVITVTASDSDGTPITYTATADSDFGGLATFTQSSNVFTITPFSEDSATTSSGTITFKASDGIGLGTSLQTFTLGVTKVTNSKYTTLLLSTDGSAGDNNDITDASSNSHTITVNGDAHATTFSPYRHGGYSLECDGDGGSYTSGGYISVPNSSDFNITNSTEFCIEFWIFPKPTTSATTVFSFWDGPSPYYGYRVDMNNSATELYWYVTASTQITVTIEPHVWQHIAIVGDGTGNTKMYVDGVQSGSTSVSYSGMPSSQEFIVGALEFGTVNRNRCSAYVSDFRFVKGSQVYTSAFTPPTERLTAITNTILLVCHLPYLADGSTYNRTITVGESSGAVSVAPFSPYDNAEYTEADHGGSISLDGSGDYLTLPNDTSINLGNSDFCMEAWVYLNSFTGADGIFNRGWGTVEHYIFGYVDNSGQINTYLGSGSSWDIVSAGSHGNAKLNEWTHVAAVRSGNTISLYLNGVRGSTHTSSGTISGDTTLTIGARDGGSNSYNGFIADARMVVGDSVYDPSSATITVPTSPLSTPTGTGVHIKGTDAHVIDKSQTAPRARTIGTAVASTAQTKYSSSSINISSTTGYVDLGTSNELEITGGPFTIECWVRPDTVTVDKVIVAQDDGSNGGQCFQFKSTSGSSGCPGFVYWTGSSRSTATGFEATAQLTANTWHHIALSYDGSTAYWFVDGAAAGTASISTMYAAPIPTMIGGFLNYPSSSHFFGYIEDLRITKGLARYTTSFTPPTGALNG